MRLEEQIYFNSRDLENLSTVVMYSFDPSQPFKNDMGRISPIRISSFSSQFSYLDEDIKPKEDYFEKYRKEQEEVIKLMTKQQEEKREQERQRIIEESNQGFGESIIHTPSKPLHYDFDGSAWGKSFGSSTDYIKELPQGSLHIHAPLGFITGAKLVSGDNEERISNYEASILDLQIGIIKKDNKKW